MHIELHIYLVPSFRSIVIGLMSSKCTAEDGERLAYLYCKQTERSSDLKNTATSLQSIVLQLAIGESNVFIIDSVMQLYKRKLTNTR